MDKYHTKYTQDFWQLIIDLVYICIYYKSELVFLWVCVFEVVSVVFVKYIFI